MSYLDVKVQQLTTTGLGAEPVKDMFKAQITYDIQPTLYIDTETDFVNYPLTCCVYSLGIHGT